MTVLDWIVIVVLVVSVLLSLMRGLAQEIFSLLAWIGAFLGAKWGAPLVAPLLPISAESENLRYFIALVVVFLVMMVLVLLLGRVVKNAINAAGLGGADKTIGSLFGLLRGGVILIGLTLAAGLTALPQTDFWKNSMFSGTLEMLATSVKPLLPERFSQHLHYR